MIIIKNSQRSIPVKINDLRQAIAGMLERAGYPDFDLNVLLTTNATVRRYNKQFRHKDKATDILSFPFYPALKAGEHISAISSDEKNLGDLIISVAYAQKDAQIIGYDLYDHLIRLCAHGLAHVLGYDHENDKDWAKMQKFEKKLLLDHKIIRNRAF
jgi:probable rRNA maturation factor